MANWRMGFFLIVVLLSASLANGGAPPDQPMLRLESGMHTAIIKRIAVDRAGRYLVTASDDKTARVWDLTDGRLLNTLRPPMEQGADEGKLYATAISPDGMTVAVGGWTGHTWDGDVSIYLFDRASGQLRRRLTGLPNVINHLAWSADGQYLAATLGGKNGVRVFSTRDGQQVMADEEYSERSNWADFDSQGRLVTSCLDGYLRLYNAAFKPIAKVSPPGGKQPFGVAFSPDGGRIAVGFADSTAVNILNGKNLTLLYSADSSGVDNGTLNSVSWSADGRWLYGGGTYQKNGMRLVRKWADKGKGKFQDFAVSPNTIMDLRPLSDGRLVFGAGDPLWGVLDGKGKEVHQQEANGADYRNNLQGFRISQDGGQVAFGFEKRGKQPARFSLVEGRLELSPQGEDNLTPPRTQADGLVVTDWQNTITPKLNGQPLALKPYEISRSLAIAPDGQSFLLGADWYLRHFDRQGKGKWQVAVPGAVWGVNVSGDGRLAVAAFGDGTIRWYEMGNGKELAAFYPHKDGKRWVAWTPEGFFNASPGGESLIGYHLNQGKEKAALFIGVEQVYETFHRPDLLARKFQGDHEEEIAAAAQAVDILTLVAQGKPPAIHILSPQAGEAGEEVVVDYCLQDQGGGIGQVVIKVNGVVMEAAEGGKGIKPMDGRCSEKRKKSLPLIAGKNEIQITAFNRTNKIESQPATLRLMRQEEEEVAPVLHVLAVGIDNYEDSALHLNFAVADAKAMVKTLGSGKGKLYREVKVYLLEDEKANRQGLEITFKKMADGMKPEDVFLLFISGHGITDEGTYYFIPQEFVYRNEKAFKEQGISQHQLQKWLAGIPAQKSVILLDTCNAGMVTGAKGLEEKRAMDNLMRAIGRNIITASTDNQQAMEGYEKHGVFSYAVLEALRGGADYDRDNHVDTLELAGYVGKRVPDLTKEKWNRKQYPMHNLVGMTFSLVATSGKTY